ncbi:hypothetical protein ACVWYH_007255 [Bradyrhizobium sp. GM24.11]
MRNTITTEVLDLSVYPGQPCQAASMASWTLDRLNGEDWARNGTGDWLPRRLP